MLYIIGSLKNPRVQVVANALRCAGIDAWDDWASVGPDCDDEWQRYERARGRSYEAALAGAHAQNVFRFDLEHLTRASAVLLVLPAGKSAHLELGWCIGRGTPAYILLEEDYTGRLDVMYAFANGVFHGVDTLVARLTKEAV